MLRRADSRASFALVLFLSLFVLALALCVNRVHNGDVYMLLASGRFLSQNGFVWHDPFPTIAQGEPWLNQQWLSELAFYGVFRSIGMTGLTVAYALVLGLALFLLLWYCRRKPVGLLLAGTFFYIPGMMAIPHPRSAGFSLLALSALVPLLLEAIRRSRTPRWVLVAVPVLFLVWVNLHGGLLAGLFMIGLVALGLGLDHLRRLPGGPAPGRIAVAALLGALAVAASFGTPLGAGFWSYVASFDNPALSLGTKEWESVFQSLPATVYLLLATGCVGWLWVRLPRPRPLAPLVVSAGFLAFALYSLRNQIFVAPALFFLIAYSPDRTRPARVLPALAAGFAAVVATVIWATALGPARAARYLEASPVEYALRNPPPRGRIAAISGVSSYVLWRSPGTPVVINGWLEHFKPTVLRANFGLVTARPGRPAPDAARWGVGAVITRHPEAARALRSQGFVLKHTAPEGFYLVRGRSGAR